MAAELHKSAEQNASDQPTQEVQKRTNREQYRTPDEDMATEFGRLLHLFERATPTRSDRAAFARLMNEASAKGLSWVEGLEYVTERRKSSLAQTKR